MQPMPASELALRLAFIVKSTEDREQLFLRAAQAGIPQSDLPRYLGQVIASLLASIDELQRTNPRGDMFADVLTAEYLAEDFAKHFEERSKHV